jgi:hypothetical protein
MTENCKLRKAILSAFYNILKRNFVILLILWCFFKLWWNFCLDLLSSKFWLIGDWSIEEFSLRILLVLSFNIHICIKNPNILHCEAVNVLHTTPQWQSVIWKSINTVHSKRKINLTRLSISCTYLKTTIHLFNIQSGKTLNCKTNKQI